MPREASPSQDQGYLDKHYPLFLRTQSGEGLMRFSADVVETLRYMLSRLISENGKLPSRLGLIAALREEGVTYLSRALGTVIAHDLPASVCVVELNWWWPAPLGIDLPEKHGMSALLAGDALDEAAIGTEQENLVLMPAGYVPLVQRSVIARSEALEDALAQLEERFDYLILDIPAIRATSDAIPLSTLADATLMVARFGVTSTDTMKLALDDIRHASVVGSIINRADLATPPWLFKYLPQG